MFFWNSLAFSIIQQMFAIWSLVPLPSLNPAWTSGSSQFTVLLKPSLENFEHYFTSMWDEHNCVVVWAFFGIAFLRDWNENWPFPVLWPLLSFPNLLSRWLSLKNLPAYEGDARESNWEDALEKEIATQSSFLAWKNPMDRGAWWAIVHGAAKSWT